MNKKKFAFTALCLASSNAVYHIPFMLIPKTSIEIAFWSASTALMTFNSFYKLFLYSEGLNPLTVFSEMLVIAPILLYLIYCAGLLSMQMFAIISIVTNVCKCFFMFLVYFRDGIFPELALNIISTLVNTVTLLGYLQLISLSPMVMAVLFWAQIVMSVVRGFLLSCQSYEAYTYKEYSAQVSKLVEMGNNLVMESIEIRHSGKAFNDEIMAQLQAKSDGIGTIINNLREYKTGQESYFREKKEDLDHFISFKQSVRS